MEHDLRERLDASFGAGPVHTPVNETLRAGRRALLRRRAAALAGTVALVAIIVTAPLTLSVSDNASPGPIGPPDESPTAPAIRQPIELPVDSSWQAECGTGQPLTCDELLDRRGPMTFLEDGTLAVRTPDVDVWERIDDPLENDAVPNAVVETELNGSVRWWLVALTTGGRVVTREMNPSGYTSDIETWAGGLALLARNQDRVVPTIPPRSP